MEEEQQTEDQELKKRKEYKENIFTTLFQWSIDEKQLRYQIENYNTAGFFSTSRKVATAVMIFLVILNLILVIVDWSPPGILIDVILMLGLASFVYKGSKWAMIITMIYWTFSKGLQVFNAFSSAEVVTAGSVLIPIVFWAIFMAVFWQAYQVERARRVEIGKKESIQEKHCSNCGSAIKEAASFCGQCGKKIK